MRRTILLAFALCSMALAATDVSGKWGGGWFVITLRQDGGILTGTAGPSANEQHPIKDGKIEGDHVTFQAGTISFDLHLDGVTLKGKATFGEESYPLNLRRPGQTATGGPPRFDVASVKPSAPGIRSSSSRLDPGRLTASGIRLRDMARRAYGVRDYQIAGPDWIETERYEVTGIFPATYSMEDFNAAVEALLVERFHLKVRHETKEMTVYALVVGKGGIKCKETDFGPPQSNLNNTKLDAKRVTMNWLAGALASQVDRPVIDATGLTGAYDLVLEWARDPNHPMENGPTADIYQAIEQQLGLKLETRKAPVEMIVIESANKVPVEN